MISIALVEKTIRYKPPPKKKKEKFNQVEYATFSEVWNILTGS